ncbi:hypothetical protein ACFLW2_03435 [Chloroflexota bacterium]
MAFIEKDWDRTNPAPPMIPYNYPRFGSNLGGTIITQEGLADEPGSVEVGISFQRMREYIYKVSGLLVHPVIEMIGFKGSDMLGPGHPGPVVFKLRYRDRPLEKLPVEVVDEYGRRFEVGPGYKTPEGRSLLHVTFETEDNRALSAVFFFTMNDKVKEFPELEIDPHVPMEWRPGYMPST